MGIGRLFTRQVQNAFNVILRNVMFQLIAVQPSGAIGFARGDRMKISLLFHVDEISGGDENNGNCGIYGPLEFWRNLNASGLNPCHAKFLPDQIMCPKATYLQPPLAADAFH